MELVNGRWWSFIKMKITKKNLKYPDLFAGTFSLAIRLEKIMFSNFLKINCFS